MLLFAVKRLVLSVPVFVAITLIAFSIIHLVPGDPARVMLGSRATDEAVANLRTQMGLDQPIVSQYLDFVSGALRLEFGNSLFSRLRSAPLLPSAR